MSKRPTVEELRFLKLSGNHLELSQKLLELGVPAPDMFLFAQYVCEAWFHLGDEHLAEAMKLVRARCPRAVYSRAYYAAYNVSKATRYIVTGFVSLKGDDHAKAIDLPGDFPNLATWSAAITNLYEHRLHADYDNWSTTATAFTLTPANAVKSAEKFIDEARAYLNSKFGMTL